VALTGPTNAPLLGEQLRAELDELVATMCRALNDPKRLAVLYTLSAGSFTVGELSVVLGTPQANTSQHLAVLRERGLVSATREGNNIRYSLRHPKIVEAVDLLREVMADEAARRHQRLVLGVPAEAEEPAAG
jgi:ArsR family transcriptional regulator